MSLIISDAAKAALIAAGGCVHTPEPHKGCDTCGRPPVEWASNLGVAHHDFQARDVDGRIYTKQDVLSVANLPLDRVARLTVATDDPQVPHVRVGVNPTIGERLFMFTRHLITTPVRAMFGGNGDRALAEAGTKTSILVLEVRNDPDDPSRFVRLYLHPTMGLILSTEDINF